MDSPRIMLFPGKILMLKTLLDLKKLDGVLKKFKKPTCSDKASMLKL
jgi:hypothetical protein